MIWEFWILTITDAVSISLVLMCFIAQMKKINTGGLYAHVRIYFATYLALFAFQTLFHFFRDLEFEHALARESIYILADRMMILAMTITAYTAYNKIK